MDILPDQSYDDITALAALICDTSIALVSLIDDGQQWFKSRHGIDADQAPRAALLRADHCSADRIYTWPVKNGSGLERQAISPRKALRPEIGGAKFVIRLPLETERTVALEQAS